MADRLTQLQDVVNQLSDHFCNSVGILQQCAQASPFPGFERPGNKSPTEAPQEDYTILFSKLIARTAKDIDVVIDSLPSEESYMELQLASLRRLEIENQDAAHKLEGVVHKGELLLEQTQQALHDIAQSQLKSQALENTVFAIDDLVLQHEVVIHERNFVDPNEEEIHGENIENLWMRLSINRRQFGMSTEPISIVPRRVQGQKYFAQKPKI